MSPKIALLFALLLLAAPLISAQAPVDPPVDSPATPINDDEPVGEAPLPPHAPVSPNSPYAPTLTPISTDGSNVALVLVFTTNAALDSTQIADISYSTCFKIRYDTGLVSSDLNCSLVATSTNNYQLTVTFTSGGAAGTVVAYYETSASSQLALANAASLSMLNELVGVVNVDVNYSTPPPSPTAPLAAPALEGGAIAGIVIGVVLGLGIIGIVLYFAITTRMVDKGAREPPRQQRPTEAKPAEEKGEAKEEDGAEEGEGEAPAEEKPKKKKKKAAADE